MTTPIQRLMALFEGNDSHYGTHGQPSRDPTGESKKWVIKPTARTLRGPTTPAMWKAHVEGKKPLGVVPIRNDNMCIWGSIDYDVYGTDLTELIKRVEELKLPLVPCRSKSGGLHLFCFAVEPVAAEKMQTALRDIAASLGIAGSEIFPKQTKILVDKGDQGSWMIMPYYGDTFGGKLETQVGMRRNGGEMGLIEFVRVAEKARVSEAQLDELKVRHLSAAPASQRGSKKGGKHNDPSVPFGDGPPCLVHILASGGIKQGAQNTTLFHMGVYFKKKYPESWDAELTRAAALYCNPPHPEASVSQLIKSLRKKDYQYKCKEEPMMTHCNSILCRKRQFGVTGGSGAVIPTITSIKKLDSDPPVWFLEVEGAKIECSTEDLQDWRRFQRILMNAVHNPFGIIPQGEWLAMVQQAMAEKVEVIEVSPDIGKRGEFHELLETWLTNRQKAEKEEDVLSGRPWLNETDGRYYFQMSKLHRYLEREGMKNLTKPQLTSHILELGGGHAKREIKERNMNLHWIPSTVVQTMPTVGTPALKERVI